MGRKSRKAAERTESKPCAVCLTPGRRSTKEDIVPIWYRKLALELVPGDEAPPRKMRICEECNRKSAERFENGTAPLLGRLARDEPTDLDPDQQQLLTSWLTKSLLMDAVADAQMPPRPGVRNVDLRNVSREPLVRLIEEGELPPRLVVRLGRVTHNVPIEWPDDGGLFPPIERPFVKLHSERKIGAFYANVLLAGDDEGEAFINSLPPSRFYLAIWPPSPEPVHWPPLRMSGRQSRTVWTLWGRGEESVRTYPRPDEITPELRAVLNAAWMDGRYGWDAAEARARARRMGRPA